MPKSTKTIVHIAMHTTNIGDGALVKGIQSTLPEDTQTEINFVDHCITDFLKYGRRKFDGQYAEWLNDNADLLLIGGGGLISEKNYLPALLAPEVIAKLKLPVVVYGIGHNLFEGERLKNPDALSALIAQIRELGGLFSVRNDGSLDRLRRDIGVSAAESVREVPDPGLFVPVESMLHPQIRPGRRNVVLQLAGDKLSNRLGPCEVEKPAPRWSLFHKKSKERHTRSSRQLDIFWAKIASVCDRLSRKHDVNFFIAPHVHSDLAVTESFVSATRHTPDFEGSRLEVSGIFRGATSAPAYFDLYRQADFVVGMRGHSIIVAVGMGTPCVAIVSHPKVEGFLKDCGLEEWSTHAADANIEESLSEKIGRLIDDSSEWKRIRNIAMERMVLGRKAFHGAIRRLMQIGLTLPQVFVDAAPYSVVVA
jgi:polysaccharide pyruvyl transferase WcaK-like protein